MYNLSQSSIDLVKDQLDILIHYLDLDDYVTFKTDDPVKFAYRLRAAFESALKLEIEPYNKLKDKYIVRVKRDRVVCEIRVPDIFKVEHVSNEKVDSTPEFMKDVNTLDDITNLFLRELKNIYIIPKISLTQDEWVKFERLVTHHKYTIHHVEKSNLDPRGVILLKKN